LSLSSSYSFSSSYSTSLQDDSQRSCSDTFDKYSPLTKGALRSDSGREAPGGCPATFLKRVHHNPLKAPLLLRLLPPFLRGNVSKGSLHTDPLPPTTVPSWTRGDFRGVLADRTLHVTAEVFPLKKGGGVKRHRSRSARGLSGQTSQTSSRQPPEGSAVASPSSPFVKGEYLDRRPSRRCHQQHPLDKGGLQGGFG